MNTLPKLNEQDLLLLSTLHQQLYNSNTPESKTRLLDPNDDQDRELIRIALQTADQTPEKYPFLHRQIDNKQAYISNDETPQIQIVDAGVYHKGNATAITWLANSKATLISGGSLMILDGEKNKLLAFGSNTDVNSGFTSIETSTETALPTNKAIRTLGVNHVIGHDGVTTFTAVANSRELGDDMDELIIDVDTPAIGKHSKPPKKAPPFIEIAVGRTGANPYKGADYYYTETQNSTDPHLLVPFVGSAGLPYTIKSGITSADIGVVALLYVDYNTPDTLITQLDYEYTTQEDIEAAITITENTVKWNFPYDKLTYKDTKSLVFDPGPVNHKYSYFYFQFTVPVTNGPNPDGKYIFSVYSHSKGVSDQPPTATGKKIAAIKFWWHCLAAGTQITMANGEQKSIEDISNSDSVVSGVNNENIGVLATTIGHHQSDSSETGLKAAYKIKTTDNKELIASGGHPIITPEGAVIACYLNVGDKVLVTDGVSQIASCESIDFSDMLYNLNLGNEEDEINNNAVNSFYANGILVGDHNAMHNQTDIQRYDLDFTLPKIDKELHQDYTSAVKDRQ